MAKRPQDFTNNNSLQPQQTKRRRVVRACDRCRKLKIKCSGDLPCIHCTVYSYECTYDQPSKSKRKNNLSSSGNPASNTTTKISLSKAATSQQQSNQFIQKPNGNSHSTTEPNLTAELLGKIKAYNEVLHKLLPQLNPGEILDPVRLNHAITEIKKNKSSNTDFQLNTAAISKSYEMMNEPSILPQYLNQSKSNDTPSGSPMHPENENVELKIIILPPLNVALDLISKTWEGACVLFRFYHRPAFIHDLNELYSTDPAHYTTKQQRFLPLVYSVLACGALFLKSDKNGGNKFKEKTNFFNVGSGLGKDGTLVDADVSTPPGQENATPKGSNNTSSVLDDEGYQYFIAARRLIDITDTRDTYGIQTIVMLIIFLQCSARLSTCYAYIGIALRAALREGLHRKLDYPFNPVELEIRKRLFWTIYKMDIYVNTMLGLPRTISSEDFDQELPVELDDENITSEGYRWDRQNRVSSSAIANCHTKVIEILRDVVAKLYPIKAKSNMVPGTVASYTDVMELENELQDWLHYLPLELKPGIEPPPEYLRANRVLHISYLHVRIVLYRPFIHYIAQDSERIGESWMIEKAMNCINVARVVVKLAEDMIKRGILSGAYWFSVYTIFFSIACLVYYVHFAPEASINPLTIINEQMTPAYKEYLAIKKDAENGKRVLDALKDTSLAARRTYNILNALFEQLNRRTAGSASSSVRNEDLNEKFKNSRFNDESNNQKGESMEEVKKISNGVNFIDGISTGVNIRASGMNSSNDVPYTYPSGITDLGSMKELSNKISEAKPIINIPGRSNIEISSLNTNYRPIKPRPITPSKPSIVKHRKEIKTEPQIQTKTKTQTQTQTQTEAGKEKDNNVKYVPGPMDQLDMKIFGRFLPPYMLGANGSTDASTGVDSPEDNKFNNDPNDIGSDVPIKSPEVPYVDLEIGSNEVLQEGEEWVNGSLLDTTNDFFNTVSKASGIPAGLSTVFQSEEDKDKGITNTITKTEEQSNSNGLLDEFLFQSNWDR